MNHRDRLLLLAQAGREDALPQYPNHGRLRDLAFYMSPDAQIVLDPHGAVVAVNNTARRMFAVGEGDIGAPLQDLEISYRPAELRPAIDRARTDRREVALRGIAWETGGTIRFLDVLVVPLLDDDRSLVGTRISYSDVTPMKSLQEELTHSKQELETAYEELQSTNEELQTMNDELRNRSTELNSSNAFLEAVFTSLRAAVVVVDRDLRVQVWNAGALDMWGLRPEEAQGNSFFTLDIGCRSVSCTSQSATSSRVATSTGKR